jgi:hypothetical protein
VARPAYPRTYPVSTGWRVFLIGISLLLGLPSLVGIVYLASGQVQGLKGGIYLLGGICAAFAALSIYLILSTLRSKIVLFADRIEIHELTVTRSLRRDEIAGWRMIGTPGLVLVRKKPKGGTVSTAWVYKSDPEFDNWFEGLDNLDLKDVESAVDAIAEDQSLGVNERERFENLDRAHRLMRILNILGGALFAWGTFLPTPHRLVIGLLLLAPWVSVLLGWRFRGLIQFDERPRDLKPSLFTFVVFPILALALRAVLDYETVGWIGQAVSALVIGSILFAAQIVAHGDIRSNPVTAIATFILAVLGYGYGAAIHINALADRADMQQIRYVLREKHISSGKVTSYRARLSKAHQSAPEVDSAEVTPYFYDMLKTGDAVCLAMRPGALGIQWFMAGPCPPGTP